MFYGTNDAEPDADLSPEARQMRDKNLSYDSKGLSLGIYTVFLGGLFLALVFYFVLKCFSWYLGCCKKVKLTMNDTLFYNAWIRYLVESNLTTTHNCVFYLYIVGWDSLRQSSFNSIIRIMTLVIVLIWPFFAIFFLFWKRQKLQTPSFKRKFTSMYEGLRLQHGLALTYTSVFCLRRLLLVSIFMGLDGHGYLLIVAFNCIQSLYLEYMAQVAPHEETIFNRLEYINELSLISVQYMMLMILLSKKVFVPAV